MSTTANILPHKTRRQAIEEAKALIQLERNGTINGLYTRWEGVNRAKMKYWRFRSVTCIAGMSGSGKSAILNMIENDFINPKRNPTFKDKVLVIAFKYEMDAADEILRTLSGKVKKSYSYLLSSDKYVAKDSEFAIKPHETSTAQYNTVTDEEYQSFSDNLEEMDSNAIVYIENAGNLDQLYATVAYIHGLPEHLGKRLVVTIDHTLLSLKVTEKDDLELMARTAKMGIKLKKEFNAAVIFLAQLNGEIEKLPRRENKNFHFPVKTDIHAQNQIFWACDDVVIFHRPELLGIEEYGRVTMEVNGKIEKHSLNSAGLIHGNWIKSRKNKTGSIFFGNRFSEGEMDQIRPIDVKWIPKPIGL